MKVSIIVAAYNIENYIERCILSCINQTYKDIEVIIVNDGSKDSTLNIIEKVAKTDERIKIINQENKGLIEARKIGYRNSTGEYILFIDGDDWIENNTVEILIDKAIQGNYDIIGYKYILAYENESLKKIKDYNEYENLIEYDFLKLILTGKIVPHIVNKFIKRSFLEINKVKFPENISFAEDLALSCSIGIHKPKACIIDEYLYYYYQRNTALTKTISPKILEVNKATEFIKQELLVNGLLSEYIEEFEYLSFVHNYLYRLDIIYSNTEISEKLMENWRKNNIDIYRNKYYNMISKKDKIKIKIMEKNKISRLLYLKLKKIAKYVL